MADNWKGWNETRKKKFSWFAASFELLFFPFGEIFLPALLCAYKVWKSIMIALFILAGVSTDRDIIIFQLVRALNGERRRYAEKVWLI